MDGLIDPNSSVGGGNIAANVGGTQSDIIAQLTREMKLQQGSGSASGLFSGSSDANVSSSSSGLGSSSHLNQLIASQIPNTNASSLNSAGLPPSSTTIEPMSMMSQQIIAELKQDAEKLAKMTSVDALNNLPTSVITSSMKTSSGSSGYKSGVGGMSGGAISGDHSSDNSFSDLTGAGKTIQKSAITSSAMVSTRLPLSSTSLLLSNNSSATSLNAASTGIYTSSLLDHRASNISTGLTDFTASLLKEQQLLESSMSAAAELSSTAGGAGTITRETNHEKKLAPEKTPLMSRSQPDLFTGIDAGTGLTAVKGKQIHRG